ncbi:replication protein P [Halopseudomonas bauzanensis]|uniref:replication protein P n=1 Tax=Halopseudomonas bauzanensis TaxID=653930 RepID=UPI0035260A37
MKTITNLIPAASRQLAVPAAVKAQELAPEVKRATESLINDLFAQLRSIYPAWKQAWTSEELYRKAKATWTQALLDAGITDWTLIERGLSRCRLEPGDFIPSAGKFIERCWPTPEELGLPETERAYWEACRFSHPSMAGHERWSHPAVYHAAIRCSRHSLLTLPTETSRLKFAKAYGEICRELAQGVVLPEPPKALPADLQRKGDVATGRAALAALRASVGGARA